MKKKDEFKSFVRGKPSLIHYVKNNEMSWQKFYELWDLYGPNHEVWNKYTLVTENNPSSSSIGDIMGIIKKLDTDTISQGIVGLQKGIGLIQDLITKDNKDTRNTKDTSVPINNTYNQRPIFRRFED